VARSRVRAHLGPHFSGAEEFTYNLKALKRATIVGETTGGGAHPTQGRRIDEHFMIGVPFARGRQPDHAHELEGWGGAGQEGAGGGVAQDALGLLRERQGARGPIDP